MSSAALKKFQRSLVGARVLASFFGANSAASTNQDFTDQCVLCASIAQAVGSWEGFVEGVLPEFVSKTRIQAHRKAWTLIVQFESLVNKLASDLNTPNWDKSRELILNITGMDPYSSWIWSPRYTNQTDTKAFFDGILNVRHSFAHGFAVPRDVPGLSVPGELDSAYVDAAISCLEFFAERTDTLLEHELKHRHGCTAGWN
jgi:lambda repressor-like predicted transcriptional regulator